MAGPHETAELEFTAGCILRGKADVCLDHGDLALLDDQHGDFFHPQQKWVEVVSAVEQGIVLESDLAAQVQELLKVLIGAVPVVLVSKNGLDQSSVRRGTAAGRRLQRFDVPESAEAAGNVTRRQRVALQRRDNADHVKDSSSLGRVRGDSSDVELSFLEPECSVRERAFLVS